ncbi:MAG: LysM peptidoglycan-binding domain-containing protein [Saprospiraceae bacterium]|nr:LysM peptidoglycan-binding domain-containing protein [Saprospiraceae bacterium]
MKRLLLVCAVLFSLAPAFAQQGPFYLMFNLACMDQLEYRSAYSGASTISFLFRPNANEYYVLTGGSSGITSATLPRNTKDCRDVVLDDPLVESVNNLTKQMYVVQQTQSGYVLTPIIGITHITRSGTYYIFRANTYSFALDTTRLMYGANLASIGSPSAVYFTGLKDIYNCRFQYSFRREPTRPNMEKSDFDFIPGVGIVADKPGMTATEAETNQSKLWAVNGRPLDDYLAALCGRQPGTTTTGAPPQYSGYPYGTTPDKEEASITYGTPSAPQSQPLAPSINPQTGLANCPEPFGKGYHIVQPGESLLAISRTYKVSMQDLVNWNKIKNPDKIEVCQKIWLQKPPANATTTPKGNGAISRPQPQSGRTVVDQSIYWNQTQGNIAPTPTTPAGTPGQADYWGQISGSSRPVLIHVVQRGETLSGLAKHYGYTDERFRRMNGFPAAGDYRLQEGQQVIVSDCEYDINSPTPTTIISTPPGSVMTPPQILPPNTDQKKAKMAGGAPSTVVPLTSSSGAPWSNSAPAPVMSSTGGNPTPTPVSSVPNNQFLENSVIDTGKEGGYVPPGARTTPAPVNRNAPGLTPAPSSAPASNAPLQEYVVKQGDTIRSIAIKYKVNESELAVTNGLDPNETLVPGKRLLIPRN